MLMDEKLTKELIEALNNHTNALNNFASSIKPTYFEMVNKNNDQHVLENIDRKLAKMLEK